MDKLKPCPFCGSIPDIDCLTTSQGGQSHLKFGRSFQICCRKCGCRQSGSAEVRFDWNPYLGLQIDDSELVKAIDRWNERAGESE